MTPMMIVLLAVPALIHLLPLSGVLGAERLEALYGVPIREPNVLLAMRHRAVLFGLLGGLLIVALFQVEFRLVAIGGCLISDLLFLLLAKLGDGLSDEMKRVVIADVIAIVCLLGAGGLHLSLA